MWENCNSFADWRASRGAGSGVNFGFECSVTKPALDREDASREGSSRLEAGGRRRATPNHPSARRRSPRTELRCWSPPPQRTVQYLGTPLRYSSPSVPAGCWTSLRHPRPGSPSDQTGPGRALLSPSPSSSHRVSSECDLSVLGGLSQESHLVCECEVQVHQPSGYLDNLTKK